MSGHTINWKLRIRVLEAVGWQCQYCGTLVERDGNRYSPNYGCCNLFVAEKYGGTPIYTNLIACCRACANYKSDLDVREMNLDEVRAYVNKKRYDAGVPYCKAFYNPEANSKATYREVIELPTNPVKVGQPLLEPPEDLIQREAHYEKVKAEISLGEAKADQPQELTEEELEERREAEAQAAVDAALAADPNFFNKKPIGGRVTDGSALERPVTPKPKAGQLEE